MNANYIGAGINIEQATDIIFFHKINKNLENQVIGRALRLDRNKNLQLNVYNLLYDFE